MSSPVIDQHTFPYILIPPGAAKDLLKTEPLYVTWDSPEPSFDEINTLVKPLLDGGELERVRVWHRSTYLDMFVDECGHLKGLPLNPMATEIYHANVKRSFPLARTSTLPIVGPAVLFLKRVWY